MTQVPGELVSCSASLRRAGESLCFLADNFGRSEATFRHKPAPGQPVQQDSAEMEVRKVRFPKPGRMNSINF